MIHLLAIAALGFGTQPAGKNPNTQLNVWVSRNVAPTSKIRININTRNLPVVHVTSFPIDGLKWLSKGISRPAPRPHAIGPALTHFDLTIAQKHQYINGNDNYFARQVNLPPMKSGVYLLTFAAAGKEDWAVVNVTNLCTVAHRSPKQSLIWVTDYKTGSVVSNARISLFSHDGQLQTSGTTRADGTLLLKTNPGWGAMVIQTKNDMAGVETSGMDPNGQLRCLFQTDRPIYRPGQTVSFKAVMRLTHDQGYDPLRNTPITVQLRDPRDNPLEEINIKTNEIGTAAASFKIPQEGMLGAYTLVLTGAPRNQNAYQTFSVAEYRKPEYKVDVKPEAKRYLSGEDLHFLVDTSYYFGAPVPQAQVRWVLRRGYSPYRWNSPEESWYYNGDGNMYPRDTYASTPFASEGVAATDNKGHLNIQVKSDPDAPDSTYSLSLTVTDSSRRQVTASASVPVYTSERRMGVDCLKQTVAIGDLVPVRVHVADLDGHPQSAKVHLSVLTQVWLEKEGKWKTRVLTAQDVSVPTTGNLTVNLPALAEGELTILASTVDRTGRHASASEVVWVASLDYKPLEEKDDNPSLELKTDKRIYKPGDGVRAYAITNRPKQPILFLMTGGDIWDYKVFQTKKRMSMWSPSTSTKQSPNAFIEALQWSENNLMSRSAVIPLPDKGRLLTVNVTPDKEEYKPGDKATYHVQTLDQFGKGVSAEVAIAVVDEAIYAISQDITPDPYQFYWGHRQDYVQMFQTAPEELSGGAFQNVSSVAPVRQRFEDTAFWQAFVKTDTQGNGEVTFEMPGNLTSWRATARAVTDDTRVGSVHMNVTATRPVTLRLATPRMVAQGDHVTMIATVNNRSDKSYNFELNLRGEGVVVESPTKTTLEVAAKSQGEVRWKLNVKDVPMSGHMNLTARVGAIGSTDPDFGDALSVSVPVVPRGLTETALIGGNLGQDKSETLKLPTDTLGQGALITVKVTGGIQALTRESAQHLLANGRYGTMWSVNAIKAAVALGLPPKSDDIREAFALLSRDQLYNGWGWWEGTPADPKITAEVGYAIALAKRHGFTVFQTTKQAAMEGCSDLYRGTNLWEDRARLAASQLMLGQPGAETFINEVIERGLKISPFSTLRMAEALIPNHRERAQQLLDRVLPLVSDGPATAYIPLGFGIGWSASEDETAAELLIVLHLLNEHPELQVKLARRLSVPDTRTYASAEDTAAKVMALSLYGEDHPDAKSIGDAMVAINGKSYPLAHSTVDESASVEIRDSILKGGSNTVSLHRSGDGETLFTVQARVYRPSLSESIRGVRVTRRFETRNDAGVWTEVAGVVKPGEPVRCTVVVWGDDISDALRLNEPIPAGFEYVDSDYTAYARQEVRDGAVVHYLLNSGTPTYFRYYIRAEADGELIALPATAEYLRRPATRGNSSATEIVVHP